MGPVSQKCPKRIKRGQDVVGVIAGLDHAMGIIVVVVGAVPVPRVGDGLADSPAEGVVGDGGDGLPGDGRRASVPELGLDLGQAVPGVVGGLAVADDLAVPGLQAGDAGHVAGGVVGDVVVVVIERQ